MSNTPFVTCIVVEHTHSRPAKYATRWKKRERNHNLIEVYNVVVSNGPLPPPRTTLAIRAYLIREEGREGPGN